MRTLLAPRPLFLASVLLVVANMSFGLYLQHIVGLAPCPLCVLQRVGFIATALLALVAAAAGTRSLARTAFGAGATLAALAGGGVAAWHSWLLANPPESLGCGRPFEWFNDDFPLVVWLPKLFRGDGDCLAVDWTMLGLGIPHWALLNFIALLVLLVWATRGAWRERRATW
jgi:disulfide bond formation protein DsbB